MSGGTIAVIAGVLVVVAGIALLGVQMSGDHGKNTTEHSFTLINAEAGSTKLHMETDFLGLPLVILGIFILVIGAIVSRGS